MRATDPVSPRAVERLKRARALGFELMIFTFRACCDRGFPIFAVTQVEGAWAGFRPDGSVVRLGASRPIELVAQEIELENGERARELADRELASAQTALDTTSGT